MVMNSICDKKLCTACMACLSECPKGCISVLIDINGYEQMHIDELNCISCGLCKKVCIANNFNLFNTIDHVYASANSISEERKKSSSGGMAYIISKEFIKNRGVVYASCFDEMHMVCIKRIDDEKDVDKIRGSKYVLSYMFDTLKKVKKDLTEGRQVLFIGTPCQCASIKKNIDSSSLFIIDLICHGVPSHRLLEEEISLHKNWDECKNIYFRKGNDFLFGIVDKNNNFEEIKLNNSLYMKGFMKALFYRESCYECKFACKERVGDITLGDFWGIENLKNDYLAANDGLSLLTVNTEKGYYLKDLVKDISILEERNVNEALAGNAQLNRPSNKHRNYKLFKREYVKCGYQKAAQKALWFDMLKSKLREITLEKMK